MHRVVNERSDYPSNRELEITPDYLEALILQYKAKGFAFVSIDQVLRARWFLPKKYVNISFDDGFKDIYTNAFPILKKYEIPFTIYLTTDFPEGKADIWWLQLENGKSVDDFERVLKRIFQSGRPMAEVMHELTDTKPDYEANQSISLSWDELKIMVDSGFCTIGSHTISHPGLTHVSLDECLSELIESKRIIKKRLGIEAKYFSYPHSMQSESIRKAVEEAGYVSATLGYGGSVRRGDDKYSLPRKYVIQK